MFIVVTVELNISINLYIRYLLAAMFSSPWAITDLENARVLFLIFKQK